MRETDNPYVATCSPSRPVQHCRLRSVAAFACLVIASFPLVVGVMFLTQTEFTRGIGGISLTLPWLISSYAWQKRGTREASISTAFASMTIIPLWVSLKVLVSI